MNILSLDKSPALRRAIDAITDISRPKILFVCLGNICRSPAAEAMMRRVVTDNGEQGKWVIDSAGTGGYHIGQLPDPRMRAHARRRGLNLEHICRKIATDDFFTFDIIIGMDSSNIFDLNDIAPSTDTQKKILPMSRFFSTFDRFDHVPDPYYDGAEGFERVLDLLDEATQNLFDTIRSCRK